MKDVTPAVSTPKDELKFIRTLTGATDALKKNLFEEDSSSSTASSVVEATTTLKGDSLMNDEQGAFEETKENSSFVQNVTIKDDALETKFSSTKYDEINNNSSVSSDPEEKTEVESTTNVLDNESLLTVLNSEIVNNNKSLPSDSEEKTEIVGSAAPKHSNQFDMNELRDALFKGDAQSLRRVLSQRSMSQRSHSFASANRNPSVSRSSSFQHDQITPDDEVLTDDSSS